MFGIFKTLIAESDRYSYDIKFDSINTKYVNRHIEDYHIGTSQYWSFMLKFLLTSEYDVKSPILTRMFKSIKH